MNLIIFFQDGKIRKVITNAVRKAGVVEGDNCKWVGKPDRFQLIWTSQTPTPIYDDEGQQTGYIETINDFTPETPPAGREQPDKMDRATKRELLARLEDLAGIGFNQVDNYIDNNLPNLEEKERQFFKKLTKINLAIIKLLQDKL